MAEFSHTFSDDGADAVSITIRRIAGQWLAEVRVSADSGKRAAVINVNLTDLSTAGRQAGIDFKDALHAHVLGLISAGDFR